MSERKAAILNVGNVLADVSLLTIAAIGGALGNPVIAGGATALSTAKASLMAHIKERKEEQLDIPVPPWWGNDDQAWQDACTHVQQLLPSVINATAARLQKEAGIPTRADVRKAFTDEIERQVSPFAISRGDIGLLADVVAGPFLERVAEVMEAAIDPVRKDATAITLQAIADGIKQLTQVVQQQSGGASPATPIAGTQVTTGVPQSTPTGAPTLSPKEQLQQKWQKGKYDVYICYHQADRAKVLEIDAKLKDRGILPWFDVLATDPDGSLQGQRDEQIRKIKKAAVFIGKHAVKDWQAKQVEALLDQFVQRRSGGIIPVFLDDAPKNPKMSVFLKTYVGVDFREQVPEPFGRLVWGITGERPPL